MQRRYPRTVLTAIVLLFEQKDEAAETVILYTIFPFVVRAVFSQAHHGHGTFMF